MKSVLTKMAGLFVLLMALTSVVSGTASAHSLTTSYQTATTAKTQARSPQACAWVTVSDWNTSFGVEVRKRMYNCTGEYYCAAIDHSYTGPFTIELSVYDASGTLVATLFKEGHISPGASVYTGPPNAPGGFSSYVCAAYQYLRY